jgi:hypothetical protein
LIIIGHDSQNRLQLASNVLASSGGVVKSDCSSGCQQTKQLVIGRGLMRDNYGQPVLAFANAPELKPAELYVIQFSGNDDALNLVNGLASFNSTQDRTVLLVCNTPAVDLAAEQAKPYTLVIIGWDQNRRLNLNTQGTLVVAECPNCQQTGVVINGVDATRTANWTLSYSVALKPAETYVLKFRDEEAALTFLRAAAPAAELLNRTVLLIEPPPAAP